MFRLLLLFLFVFELQASADVIATARNIKRGEIITQDDIFYETIQSKLNKNYITNIEFDVGIVRASKNLESGKYLKKNDLYIDTAIVHKGERVTAMFIRKNLSIEIPCIALTDGNLNETVKIKGIDSNKLLTGQVMENGIILIGK